MLSNSLTLAGGFYLESANELFQLFATAFWALHLPSIVLSNAENESEFLAAFRASIVVAGHTFSFLSLLKWIFQTTFHYLQQIDITIERRSSVNR